MLKKSKPSLPQRRSNLQSDTSYFLKMVIFLILGSQWIRIEHFPDWSIPLPVGLALGLVFAAHDHFMIDRKIEYVLLLLSAFVAFWLPMGLMLRV